MAKGYPDWWIPTIPGRPILGSGQYYWHTEAEITANTTAWWTVLTEAVPAGRRRFITAGFIDCVRAGLIKMRITFPPITNHIMRFNTLWTFSLNPAGCFVVEENETILIEVYNRFSGSTIYGAILLGFEEVM